MIFSPPQHGKLCSNSTIVYTKDCIKKHGDLRVGDYVFGRNGQSVKVLAISEEMMADRKVIFTDGSEIVCHENHEWLVYDRLGDRNVEMVVTTKEIESMGVWLGEHKRGGRARFQVDANTCIDFEERVLLLHPYVLGVWLGDGKSSYPTICYHPKDRGTIDKIVGLGYKELAVYTHKITGVLYSVFGNRENKDVLDKLKEMNLINNKHIPDEYIFSSVEQRLELLAGLIDTDGYVYQKNGRVTFSNANKILIDDVAKLVVSLGWRYSISEFEPVKSSSGIQGKQVVYQLCFNPTCDIPTALERKKIIKIKPVVRRRGIKSIEKCEEVPGRCIQVEGGVYLVGENLIPTHNSELVSVRLPAYWIAHRPYEPVLISSYGALLAGAKAGQARRIVCSQAYKNIYEESLTNKYKDLGATWKEIKDDLQRKISGAGVGGAITGFGGGLGIIDDPIKNFEQAMSSTFREKTWEWWKGTFRTRIWEHGAIVIILTRWHESDLAGRLLNSTGERWKVYRLPAIAETEEERKYINDVFDLKEREDWLGRKAGEALAPIRFSKKALMEIKDDVGSLVWSAEYQGFPRSYEGNIIKRQWLILCAGVPADAKRVRYWDKAATEESGDESVGLLVAYKGGITYIEDVVKGRWGTLERRRIMLETAIQDAEKYGKIETKELPNGDYSYKIIDPGPRIIIEYEPGSGGKDATVDEAKLLRGFNVRFDRPTKELAIRIMLSGFMAQAEIGNVRIVSAKWTQEVIEQLTGFPNAPHDDIVATIAGAYKFITIRVKKVYRGSVTKQNQIISS
jgi:hypothetical protein